jgi:hypothetical protein
MLKEDERTYLTFRWLTKERHDDYRRAPGRLQVEEFRTHRCRSERLAAENARLTLSFVPQLGDLFRILAVLRRGRRARDASVAVKHGRRVEPRRTSRRHIARQRRCRAENHHHQRERRQIRRFETEQQRRHEAGHDQRRRTAREQAKRRDERDLA